MLAFRDPCNRKETGLCFLLWLLSFCTMDPLSFFPSLLPFYFALLYPPGQLSQQRQYLRWNCCYHFSLNNTNLYPCYLLSSQVFTPSLSERKSFISLLSLLFGRKYLICVPPIFVENVVRFTCMSNMFYTLILCTVENLVAFATRFCPLRCHCHLRCHLVWRETWWLDE